MITNFTVILDYGYNASENIVSRIGYLFYVVNPHNCMFEDVSQVPRYVEEMFPVFVILALIENFFRLIQGKSILRANDTMASIGQGIFQECIRLNLRSFEVLVYCLIWDNWRIWTLSWHSLTTWWLCFLGVDLGFYIFHRTSHEVNIIWSVHQAHHSAEDFTMISSLRQAALQPFTAWFAYLPLAFFVPPPIFLTHLQLSELYMIWIHTEVIKSLGPLEWVLNTPSHHRVHHGRNRPYIDKNYGGTLIIWDRLFGTFQAEQPTEPVVYGLVHPIQSYNPFYLQFHHMVSIGKNVIKAKDWKDSLDHVWKGPGWAPGKPRLGDLNDVPLIEHPVTYWSPSIPIWQTLYSIFHFGIILLLYNGLIASQTKITQMTITFCISLLLLSITTIGFLLENRRIGIYLELLRCLLFLSFSHRIWIVVRFPIYHEDIWELFCHLITFAYVISAVICASIIIYDSIPEIKRIITRIKPIRDKKRDIKESIDF